MRADAGGQRGQSHPLEGHLARRLARKACAPPILSDQRTALLLPHHGLSTLASSSRSRCAVAEALRYFGGATARAMIDNTHVVVLRGSGRDMVPVPEMAASGERFGFQFVAHA